MRVPGRIVALTGLLMGAGCEGRGEQREDARRLLTAYEELTAADVTRDREARLEALRALPLHTEAPDAARDLCVEAHAALLEAEAQQEQAAVLLDQALAGAGGDALPPEKIASVQAGITRSEESLKQARSRFSDCEDRVRDLAIRFGERR